MTPNAVRSLTAAALAAGIGGAWAQTHPTQPMRIVSPYRPGGTSDILARALGKDSGARLE